MNYNGRMAIAHNALCPGKAACSARFSSPARGPARTTVKKPRITNKLLREDESRSRCGAGRLPCPHRCETGADMQRAQPEAGPRSR